MTIVAVILFIILAVLAWYWYGKVNGDVKILHERISDLREEFEGKHNTIYKLIANKNKPQVVKIKYFKDDINKIHIIDKGNFIDLCAADTVDLKERGIGAYSFRSCNGIARRIRSLYSSTQFYI